jgi:hypothetical protein
MSIPSPWTIPEIEAALEAARTDNLTRITVAASMDPPEDEAPGWAEGICLRLAGHDPPHVRGGALIGFGHLACRAGVIRNESAVRAAVIADLAHPDPWIAG